MFGVLFVHFRIAFLTVEDAALVDGGNVIIRLVVFNGLMG